MIIRNTALRLGCRHSVSCLLLNLLIATVVLSTGTVNAAEPLTVREFAGAVKLKIDDRWQDPQIDMTVTLPATVSTGDDGSIKLVQGGTVYSVAANTALELLAGPETGQLVKRVVQSKGSAFYDVSKREHQKLRVETPYLVAVIKGTQFNVTVEPASTSVALFEGLLQIEAPDTGEVIDLHAGFIANRRQGDSSITVIRMEDGEPVSGSRSGVSGSGNGGSGSSASGAGNDDGAGIVADDGSTGSTVNDAVVVLIDDGILSTPVANGDDAGGDLTADLHLNDAGFDPGTIADLGPETADLGLEAASDLDIGGLGDIGDIGDMASGLDADLDLELGGADLGIDVGTDLAVAEIDAGLDADLGGDLGADLGADLGIADLDAGLDAGVDADLGSGDLGVDLGADLGADLGIADIDAGLDTGIDADLGSGELGVDLGADLGADLGVADVDAGLDTGVDADLGSGDLGVDLGADLGADLGVTDIDAGLDTGVDADLGSGDLGVDLGADAGVGDDIGLGLDAGVDAGLGDGEVGVDLGADVGVGSIDTGIDAGVDADLGSGDVGIDVGVGDVVGVDVGLDDGGLDVGLDLGGLEETTDDLLGGLLGGGGDTDDPKEEEDDVPLLPDLGGLLGF